jgi:hypothetical protein
MQVLHPKPLHWTSTAGGLELDFGKDDIWFLAPNDDINFLCYDFKSWAIGNMLIVVLITRRNKDP